MAPVYSIKISRFWNKTKFKPFDGILRKIFLPSCNAVIVQYFGFIINLIFDLNVAAHCYLVNDFR